MLFLTISLHFHLHGTGLRLKSFTRLFHSQLNISAWEFKWKNLVVQEKDVNLFMSSYSSALSNIIDQ